VNGVSFSLDKGETLALVGESASGKSTLAQAVMGVLPRPGRLMSGEVLFKGQNLAELPDEQVRQLRGKQISMVLQNPTGAFDPVYSIGKQIVESIHAHEQISETDARARVISLLIRVGIPNPEVRFHQYPHQFSGGMSQRALIAMALIGNPDLLIADEPTSALDVTVQAQIVELLRDLQNSLGLALILVTHDLGLAAMVAHRVAVMYAGRIVEYGNIDDIFYKPRHPYTAALLASALRLNEDRPTRLSAIKGAPPDPLNLPSGCNFHPRRQYVMEICKPEDPMIEDDGTGHLFACHLDAEGQALLPPARRETGKSIES
jgi:oligopeptide/dipeptide ABC transporter ATP-binding protein